MKTTVIIEDLKTDGVSAVECDLSIAQNEIKSTLCIDMKVLDLKFFIPLYDLGVLFGEDELHG